MITLTTKAAKQVGIPNGLLFNDRLKNGNRSLKVPGWTKTDYQACAAILIKQGAKVSLVDNPGISYSFRSRCYHSNFRLHVKES